MKMVNLKRTEKREPEMPVGAESEYPYGLSICLDSDTLKKLGIKDLPAVGTKMTIECKVEVCSTSEYASKMGVDQSLSLQITDMGVGAKKKVTGDDIYGTEGA